MEGLHAPHGPLLDEEAWARELERERARGENWSDLAIDPVADAVWHERRFRRRAIKTLGWLCVALTAGATALIGSDSPRARREMARWATFDPGPVRGTAHDAKQLLPEPPPEPRHRAPVVRR